MYLACGVSSAEPKNDWHLLDQDLEEKQIPSYYYYSNFLTWLTRIIPYGISPLLLEGKKLESHSSIRNSTRADSVAVPDGSAPTPTAAIFCPLAPHSTFSPALYLRCDFRYFAIMNALHL